MRLVRSEREFLIDELMTLALLRLVPAVRVGDRLKVVKLLFLATYELFKRRWKALNFCFYRYTYGPFTPQVYEVWGDLSWSELMSIEPRAAGLIYLTPKGRRLADSFIEEVLSQEDNAPIKAVIDSVAKEFGTQPTNKVLQLVYDMPVQPVGQEVSLPLVQVPVRTQLTAILEFAEAEKELTVPQSWLARLETHRLRIQTRGVRKLQQAYQFISPQVLTSLMQAIAADERGERKAIDWKEIQETYGIK